MEFGEMVRLSIFTACVIGFGLAERLAPRRSLTTTRLPRWFANLGVTAINNLAIRFLFPILPVGVALWAANNGYGFFNLTSWPYWIESIIAVVLLDLIIYGQHRMFHVVPFLWQLHIAHHADPDIDLTTGIRFHPVEIAISVVIKLASVLVLGPSLVSVIVFEVLLNATAMFNHANWRLPPGFDKYLRLILVTPDMHRVHHSIRMAENRSNYGFNLPWWDYLLASYQAQPIDGHTDMTIGLSQYQDTKFGNMWWLLAVPFLPKTKKFAKATGGVRKYALGSKRN